MCHVWAGVVGLTGQGLAETSLPVVWQRVAEAASPGPMAIGTSGELEYVDAVAAAVAARETWETKQNRPKRARIPAPLRKALEAMWPAMPSQAKKPLEEAGYQPPEAAAEEKDLIELLRTFEDKLPSEVIAALPTKPTLGRVEEGREVADKYAEAARELRILGREKLDLQSRIDAGKANLLFQLKKMQQLQDDIRKAQEKINQELGSAPRLRD